MLQNTQDPTKHRSELLAITCFPVNHLWLGFRQKSSVLMAVEACRDLHSRVGRDRFPLCVVNGVSRNVPAQTGLGWRDQSQGKRTGWHDGIVSPTEVVLQHFIPLKRTTHTVTRAFPIS